MALQKLILLCEAFDFTNPNIKPSRVPSAGAYYEAVYDTEKEYWEFELESGHLFSVFALEAATSVSYHRFSVVGQDAAFDADLEALMASMQIKTGQGPDEEELMAELDGDLEDWPLEATDSHMAEVCLSMLDLEPGPQEQQLLSVLDKSGHLRDFMRGQVMAALLGKDDTEKVRAALKYLLLELIRLSGEE
jgi:hypothetical protein